MKHTYILLLLFFFHASCLSESTNSRTSDNNTEPVSASILLEYRYCLEDSECTYVTNGCCDCANGGEDAAINNNVRENFLELFDCQNYPCTMKAKIPRYGSGTVFCDDGLCTYNES